ncbi:hypothetical protein Lal_00046096, partial [Lupinus albus]
TYISSTKHIERERNLRGEGEGGGGERGRRIKYENEHDGDGDGVLGIIRGNKQLSIVEISENI